MSLCLSANKSQRGLLIHHARVGEQKKMPRRWRDMNALESQQSCNELSIIMLAAQGCIMLHLQPIAAPLQIAHIDFCHSTAHDPLTQPFACFLPLLDLVASGFRTVEKIASFREDFNATGGCRRQHRSINFSSNVQPS